MNDDPYFAKQWLKAGLAYVAVFAIIYLLLWLFGIEMPSP